jgi:hypothetical protein
VSEDFDPYARQRGDEQMFGRRSRLPVLIGVIVVLVALIIAGVWLFL